MRVLVSWTRRTSPPAGSDPGSGDSVDARTVDVHLGWVRAKLGPAGSRIETVFGLGYRFAENV